MTTFRAMCFLSVFVCAAAQGQNCSGGGGGGMDASGNQCNAPGNDVDFRLPTAVLERPVASSTTQAQAKATQTSGRSVATMAPGPQVAAVGQPRNRFPANAMPAAEPTKAAKMETSSEVPCSGGRDGGMDATGNQCNAAELPSGAVMAQARGR